MDGLVKAAIIGGIGYVLWKAITPATSTTAAATAPAGSGGIQLQPGTSLNLVQTPGRTTIFPGTQLTPQQQADLDAYYKANGLPTDAELAQMFGWQDFNSWFNSLTTSEQAQAAGSGAATVPLQGTIVRGASGGGLNAQQHFDALDHLTMDVL